MKKCEKVSKLLRSGTRISKTSSTVMMPNILLFFASTGMASRPYLFNRSAIFSCSSSGADKNQTILHNFLKEGIRFGNQQFPQRNHAHQFFLFALDVKVINGFGLRRQLPQPVQWLRLQ